MRRDRDDLEVVDLVELLGLGHRGAGHARELVVQPEVVLERDRREGPGLALDAQALLRLDRLVEALAPAAARHLAPGELVDDDDLAVLDDVVPVTLVQRVRLERGVEVPGEPRVRVVQVRDAEELLDLVDALLGGRDRLVLEVEEVVAALLGALGTLLELRHEPGEREVQVRRFLGLAGDDQRRPRLVDEDVVDLVDDGERPLALDPALELVDHVVAQVVEPELVVRAVRDVRGVGLAARDGPEVDQALVRRRVARLEQVGRVVGDDPERQSEEVVDRPHPLRVAPREVVVHRDEVGAPADEAVERQGQRRDERLALARLHLGDPALVEDDAADELHVEVAHAQRSPAGLAGGGEDLGDRVVERGLDALVLALPPRLGEVAPPLGIGVVELVVGGLLRLGDLADVGLDGIDPLADLEVGEGLVLRLELVDLVDQRLETGDLAVVGIEES